MFLQRQVECGCNLMTRVSEKYSRETKGPKNYCNMKLDQITKKKQECKESNVTSQKFSDELKR